MVDIGFDIKSVFDNSGVKEAEAALDSLKDTTGEMDVSARELSGRMDALDISFDQSAQEFKDINNDSLNTQEAVSALSSEFAALQNMSEQSGRSLEIVQNRLDASRTEIAETEKGVASFRDEMTGSMSESREALSRVNSQVQTFNEEALSALFAALAVGRQIGELTKPGMEAAGVFDLISNTLKLFFLPIALVVRDWVLKIRDALLGLPKEAKLVIGAIALLIAALAKGLAIFAAFKINAAGIGTALTFLGGKVTAAAGLIKGAFAAVAAALGTSVAVVLTVVGAVIAIVAFLAYAWKTNLLGIRQKVGSFVKWIGNNFPSIVRAVVPVIGVMDLLIKAVNRLFGKDIDTLGEKFEGVGDSIANMGDNMIETGNKMDEMKKKQPKDAKGFKEKFMPDVGGSKTKSKGTNTQIPKQEKNNVRNTYNIKTRKGQDPQDVANEVNNLHKKSKDLSTRET